jgi:hypothetical protein
VRRLAKEGTAVNVNDASRSTAQIVAASLLRATDEERCV